MAFNAQHHNRIARRGLMLVLSSPSGAGKTTISRKMLEYDDNLSMSVSVTTREQRPGEKDGTHYYFVSKEQFADMIMNEQFLEHAKVFDDYYGTPRNFVEEALSEGLDVLFDIDWQGTRQLKNNARHDLVSVFILPPSMTELEKRLRNRAQDSDATVRKRMAKSADEIGHWDEYDYVLVNEDVDETLQAALAILRAERLKRSRQEGLSPFIDELIQQHKRMA